MGDNRIWVGLCIFVDSGSFAIRKRTMGTGVRNDNLLDAGMMMGEDDGHDDNR